MREKYKFLTDGFSGLKVKLKAHKQKTTPTSTWPCLAWHGWLVSGIFWHLDIHGTIPTSNSYTVNRFEPCHSQFAHRQPYTDIGLRLLPSPPSSPYCPLSSPSWYISSSRGYTRRAQLPPEDLPTGFVIASYTGWVLYYTGTWVSTTFDKRILIIASSLSE